jgi:molecular chaperone GrpE
VTSGRAHDPKGGGGRKAPSPPRHTSGKGPSGPLPAESDGAAADALLAQDLVTEIEAEATGDALSAELDAAREEAADCRDKALRAQAEFDNFRKRIAREREEERRRAGERLVGEILPVIDNLERAIDHTTAGGDLRDLLTGVEAVHTQLVGVLGKEGVEVIDPFGQPFDPNTQQAVSQMDDPEVAEGTVVEVFQKGYSLGGRIIRSAMVVVSTGGPPPGE